MVAIIDPHFKRVDSYPVYKEARDLGIITKVKDGQTDYEGWCWSGSSAWVDFFNPASWGWWKGLFKTVQTSSDKFAWTESTNDVHIWNDMNEVSFCAYILLANAYSPQPAIFNGPEISMPRDNIHHGGWEHRDIHNIHGMLYVSTVVKSGCEVLPVCAA